MATNLSLDGLLIMGGTTPLMTTNYTATTASNSGRDSDSVTANVSAIQITTYALTTLAGSVYTLTVTNSQVTTTSMLFASVFNGGTSTATAGNATVVTATPKAGAAVVVVGNLASTSGGAAFNGTLKVNLLVFN